MLRSIGFAFASKSARSDLKPFAFQRKDVRAGEVLIDIEFCGVCHSDVHQARNEWKNTVYPCMPGHEIVGTVAKLGAGTRGFKVGDRVGVGCLINSCGKCENCKKGLEQCCEKGATATYNGNMKEPNEKNNTFGGYSNQIVVNHKFVLRIPKNIPSAEAAPLLCAGITTYSPLKQWNVGRGTKVGVVGIGGLGHVAVKIAKALGAEVTAITSSPDKRKDALKMGAKATLLSTDKKAMEKAESTFDFILSTIPQPHDANPFMKLLKTDGVLDIVGCLAPLTKPLDMSEMLMSRRTLATSLIGGIAETQEVLDFCSKHGITPNIEIIPIDDINKAFDKLDKGDVDFRYVIDMASLAGEKDKKSLLEAVGIVPDSKKKPH